MYVTSGVLERVARDLARFSSSLDDAALSVVAALESTAAGLGDLDAAWSGPRPGSIGQSTRTYIDSVRDVVDAVQSASTTSRRWAAAALDHAAVLAEAEHAAVLAATELGALNEAATSTVEFEARDLIERRLTNLELQIDETRVSWRRCCHSHSDQLGAAIAVIERCNSAAFGGRSWNPDLLDAGFASPGWSLRELGFGSGTGRGAPIPLTALLGGVPLGVAAVLAALDEVARRDDAAWQAILDEAGVPPGEFTSIAELQSVYGTRQDEGGWFLVNRRMVLGEHDPRHGG